MASLIGLAFCEDGTYGYTIDGVTPNVEVLDQLLLRAVKAKGNLLGGAID